MTLDPGIAVLILMSYLSGGIPTGYLVVKRLKGIDIREHGSGNPGTANVYRVAGLAAGLVTLFVDALKGYLPVLLAQLLHPERPALMAACGAAAVIGHDWTIFLGFRGGKGVATSAGVFAAVTPLPLACAVGVFALGIARSGHISVGSLSGAVALPFLALLWGSPPLFIALAAAAGVLIIYKHIPNMRRLLASRELQIHAKK